MASCPIFHGPGAREAACRKVGEVGHFIVPPYGDEGLDAKEAREITGHLLNTPRLSGLGCVVVGPMDEVKSPEASDALLKIIEDFDGEVVLPILWAHDLNRVSLTIRSRCLDIWCPGKVAPSEDDDKFMGLAWDLINKAVEGKSVEMPSLIKSLKDGQMGNLVAALSDVLASQVDNPEFRKLWDRIRPVIRWSNPKPVEVLSALMGNGD